MKTPKDVSTGRWNRYEFLPSPLLGFDGCDQSVGEAIFRGDLKDLLPSQNDYDWLGTGIYFWEGNPQRAFEFAQESARGGRNSRGAIKKPFILGAVLNLKRCLDLADSAAIAQVQEAHHILEEFSQANGEPIPENGAGLRTRQLDSPCSIPFTNRANFKACPPTTPFAACFGKTNQFTPARASARRITSKFVCAT